MLRRTLTQWVREGERELVNWGARVENQDSWVPLLGVSYTWIDPFSCFTPIFYKSTTGRFCTIFREISVNHPAPQLIIFTLSGSLPPQRPVKFHQQKLYFQTVLPWGTLNLCPACVGGGRRERGRGQGHTQGNFSCFQGESSVTFFSCSGLGAHGLRNMLEEFTDHTSLSHF